MAHYPVRRPRCPIADQPAPFMPEDWDATDFVRQPDDADASSNDQDEE